MQTKSTIEILKDFPTTKELLVGFTVAGVTATKNMSYDEYEDMILNVARTEKKVSGKICPVMSGNSANFVKCQRSECQLWNENEYGGDCSKK